MRAAQMEVYRAPFYMFWLARLFGRRHIGTSDGYGVTMYHWRGRFYVTRASK